MAKPKKTASNATPAADKPAETKAAKFARLGMARVPRAVKAITNIGNLAGSGYESTTEQREKIITTLEAAVAAVKARFSGTADKGPAFTL